MKVDFKEMAKLVITPENETENYALKKWFEGYTNESPSEEILSIDLFSVSDTNSVQQ